MSNINYVVIYPTYPISIPPKSLHPWYNRDRVVIPANRKTLGSLINPPSQKRRYNAPLFITPVYPQNLYTPWGRKRPFLCGTTCDVR